MSTTARDESPVVAPSFGRTSLDDGELFAMGRGTSRAVLSQTGMQRISLNCSLFHEGDEFPQHRHDESEDCMVVIQGAVAFKQGARRRRIEHGDRAWVPIGEVHGTINDSGATAELISFQCPPDLALYRGERNKKDGDVPTPSGRLFATTAKLWETSTDGHHSQGWPVQGTTQFVEGITVGPHECFTIEPDGEEHVLVFLEGRGTATDHDEVERAVGPRHVLFGVFEAPVRIQAESDPLIVVHAASVSPSQKRDLV